MAAAGGGSFIVSLPATISATDTVIIPLEADASLSFNRDGTYSINGTPAGDWVAPKHSTIGDQYDVKFDYTSGTPTTEAAADDTYIQMSSTRTWTEHSAGGTETTLGTISIRLTGVGSALASTNVGGVTLEAESTV